jgi:hypothetical protein
VKKLATSISRIRSSFIIIFILIISPSLGCGDAQDELFTLPLNCAQYYEKPDVINGAFDSGLADFAVIEDFELNNSSLVSVRTASLSPAGWVYIEKTIPLDFSRVAAVVIDPWREEPAENDSILGSYTNRLILNMNEVLLPNLEILRSNNIPIIIASYGSLDIADLRVIGESDIVLDFIYSMSSRRDQTDAFVELLNAAGIDTLLYLGYSGDGCLIMRSVGVFEMLDRGFRAILLRDSTVAKEFDSSVANEWMKNVTSNMIEEHANGYSATINDLFPSD